MAQSNVCFLVAVSLAAVGCGPPPQAIRSPQSPSPNNHSTSSLPQYGSLKDVAAARERYRLEQLAERRKELTAEWQERNPPKPAETSNLPTRDQLRSTIELCNSMDRIAANLGRPSSARDYDRRTEWIYRGRSINPGTGKPDDRVVITFIDGQLDKIVFY
jgi:hypothetical protein